MKNLLSGIIVIAAILGAFAFFGLTPFGKQIVQEFGATAGSTFNTAKVAAVNFTPATSAASSTSMLNTDANTRYVTGGFVACQGVGGQGGAFTAATTSVANLGLQGNTNLAENIFATTSAPTITFMYSASSTQPAALTTGINFAWAAGTYLTFVDSLTNTGVCTVGVNYLAS